MSASPFLDYVGTPVHKEQCRNAWTFYHNNVVAMNCARIIKNAVLANGVGSSVGDEFMVRHMNTFARNCVDWLLCIGVVPVAVHSLESGQKVPVVPHPHRVHLSVCDLPSGDVGYRGILSGGSILPGDATGQNRDVLVWGGGVSPNTHAVDIRRGIDFSHPRSQMTGRIQEIHRPEETAVYIPR